MKRASARIGVLAAAGWLWACAHPVDDAPAPESTASTAHGGSAAGGKGRGGSAGSSGGGGHAGSSVSGGSGGASVGGGAGTAPLAQGGEAVSLAGAGGAPEVPGAGGDGSGATVPPAGLEVEHKSENSDPNDNQIRIGLRILNMAQSAVDLSTLELRYYFTSEVALPLTVEVYDAARDGASGYQTVGKDAVQSSITSADGYLALDFTSAAGALTMGDALTLDIAVHGPNWTGNFSESDDYSFAADHTDFVPWNHVTLLSGKTLLWGKAPP